jgi:hypothetical protein
MKRPRSVTVEYMLPAGAIPNWKVGASARPAIHRPHLRHVPAPPPGRPGARRRSPVHPQGAQDLLVQDLVEGGPPDHLQHVPHRGDGGIGVLGPGLRGVDQVGAVQAGHGGRQGGLVVVEVAPHRGFADQPRAVRHELPQGDLTPEGIAGGEVREIAGHRGVQLQLAPLHHLHHRDVGEELRHRAHAVHGGGRGGGPRLRVLHPEPLRPDDVGAVHKGDGDRRQPLVLHLVAMRRRSSPATGAQAAEGATAEDRTEEGARSAGAQEARSNPRPRAGRARRPGCTSFIVDILMDSAWECRALRVRARPPVGSRATSFRCATWNCVPGNPDRRTPATTPDRGSSR